MIPIIIIIMIVLLIMLIYQQFVYVPKCIKGAECSIHRHTPYFPLKKKKDIRYRCKKCNTIYKRVDGKYVEAK